MLGSQLIITGTQILTIVFQDGYSPLLQANQDGHLEIVKLLFEYNPEIDANKTTPVSNYIFKVQSQNECFHVHGFMALSCVAWGDWSALLMAARNGHEAIMQFLVDHGADVNHKKEEISIVVLMIRVCCSVLSFFQ